MNFFTKIRKKKSKSVFFITTMTKCDEASSEKHFDRFGSIRTVGYRDTLKAAQDVVKYNMCDIYEYCYNYACIEEIGPEIYPEVRNRWFYKFNRETDCYEPIDTPDYLCQYENFVGIG
jgi:hypothetical protein